MSLFIDNRDARFAQVSFLSLVGLAKDPQTNKAVDKGREKWNESGGCLQSEIPAGTAVNRCEVGLLHRKQLYIKKMLWNMQRMMAHPRC